jgi:hypothetical protein
MRILAKRPKRSLLALLVGAAGLLGACSTTPTASTDQVITASNASVALNGCSATNVPPGFVLDQKHSGSITPGQYSASGDIQASLVYDQYQQGLRNVFTQLSPSPSSTNHDLVIECVGMRFGSSSGANRFLQSFEYLRSQARGIAKKVTLPGRLSGDSVGYQESQQAFSGYNITSTDVVETADQQGNYFYDVSVAGPAPAVTTAFDLLAHLASQA